MTLDSTVQFVRMAGQFRPLPRPHRVPRGQPSLLPESDYARTIVTWLDEFRAELAALPRLLSEPRWDGVRLDESPHGRRVRQLTEPVRRKVERDVNRLARDAEKAGRAVAQAHKQVLDRQSKAALGVEIPTTDARVPTAIDSFVSKNMTRIRSLGDKLVGEVETIVIDAWDKGLSQAEVAAEIEKRLGVAETYARYLARDQMGALYSQVTRARHAEIGVRLFEWQTERDGNVRASHAVKHGKVFPYEGSRAPSFFPGDEPGCRCWEVPVFDEIKAAAFGGKGRKRTA